MSAFLPGEMEGYGCQSIYFENHNGIADPVQYQTPSYIPINDPTKKIQDQSFTRNVRNNREIKRSRNIRKTIKKGSGFYVQNVFGEEGRWGHTPYFRPPGSQLTCFNKTLQAGVSQYCSGIFTATGLDDKNRFVSGLLPCPDGQVTQTISKNSVQWRDTSANCSSIWPGVCPTNLCSSFELDRGGPSFQRFSSAGLLRRLPIGKPGLFQIKDSGCGNREPFGTNGVADKLCQINPGTYTGFGVFGPMLEHSRQHKIIAKTKGKKSRKEAHSTRNSKPVLPAADSDYTRSYELCQLGSPQRPATLPKVTNIPETIQSGEPLGKENDTTRSPYRNPLVEGCSTPCIITPIQREHNPLPDNGRIGCRMGSPVERTPLVRKMVQDSEDMALQHEGNVCSLCHNEEPEEKSRRCSHSGSNGQSDLGGLYPEGGRHQVLAIAASHDQAADALRPAECVTVGLLPPGEVQRHRRPALTRQTASRMAPTPSGHGGHIRKMGIARGRLVCVRKRKSGSKVRNSRLERWLSRVLQRIQSTLGVQARMDFSTSQLTTTSTPSLERVEGNIHTDCPSVESVLLDTGPSGSCPRETHTNSEPAEGTHRHDNRPPSPTSGPTRATSLEDWGWSDQVVDWDVREKELLKSSWRPSTLSTYMPAIKRWISWCTENKIDNKSPGAQDLAKFLASLHLDHNLAYSTILLHKSAVSTYCANTINIGNNFLIKQILKAIANAKPMSRKPPIWDTKVLYDWLMKTPLHNTLFDTARRTSVILLLASGRRIHDLTLLDISEDSIIESDDNLILWPTFGSKTDTASRRQSGWCLTPHPEKKICPVEHVRLLITMSKSRRMKVTNLNNLFITVTGPVKQATKTNIAGWIRTVFRDAGIDASPGSLRSAVASKSWLDNRPVDEILERGNWKCFATFRKYYYRPVEKSENSHSTDMLHGNFKCI